MYKTLTESKQSTYFVLLSHDNKTLKINYMVLHDTVFSFVYSQRRKGKADRGYTVISYSYAFPGKKKEEVKGFLPGVWMM